MQETGRPILHRHQLKWLDERFIISHIDSTS
jgi:hypothetical protein